MNPGDLFVYIANTVKKSSGTIRIKNTSSLYMLVTLMCCKLNDFRGCEFIA